LYAAAYEPPGDWIESFPPLLLVLLLVLLEAAGAAPPAELLDDELPHPTAASANPAMIAPGITRASLWTFIL
jgi:hypothetical protein